MDNSVFIKSKFKKGMLQSFIVVFIFLFSLTTVVLYFIEKEIRRGSIDNLKVSEKQLVELENQLLGDEFSSILSDLFYFDKAFGEQLSHEENYETIAENWRLFLSQQKIYDQIRFIDTMGDEKIRINLTSEGGDVVPQDQLQNKKDRYYFYETIKLEDKSAYVSQLDLNIEQGQIEQPYKPMIRFSTPVYNELNELQGVIVLNYMAEKTIQHFRDIAKNSGGEMVLLNSEGYYLSSDNPELEWGFMFDDRKTLTYANDHPSVFNSKEIQEGQLINENGLFTCSVVELQYKVNKLGEHTIVLGGGDWYVVSYIDRYGAQQGVFNDQKLRVLIDVFKKNVAYFLIMTFVSSIVAILVHINKKVYDEIKFHSEFDGLTKVYNRRAGIDKLNKIIDENGQRKFVFSLCFIDINGLKQVNDFLGHQHGDDLIVTAVEGIRQTIREEDFVMRLGGDEFMIVCMEANQDDTENIWDRIVNYYKEINGTENRPYIISASHGIVSHDNYKKSPIDELIKKADEKMYEEKRIIKANLKVIR